VGFCSDLGLEAAAGYNEYYSDMDGVYIMEVGLDKLALHEENSYLKNHNSTLE
jgi:hypothetical protein